MQNAEKPMKIAVIADIHGNALALAAVLADITKQNVDDILNLGDHFSGPLDAQSTADQLVDSDVISILGNHDRYLIEHRPDEMGPSDKAAYTQLSTRAINWLKNLKPTHIYKAEIFMCHGTPDSDTTYWMEQVSADGVINIAPRIQIEAHAKGVDYPIILCGHTHIPRMLCLSGGRMLVNPGSVGCPAYDDDNPVYHIMQSGTPDACYAIVEKQDGKWNASFRYVKYDNLAAAQMAKDNGREDWVGGLKTGFYS